jgi:hypothetical protein
VILNLLLQFRIRLEFDHNVISLRAPIGRPQFIS